MIAYLIAHQSEVRLAIFAGLLGALCLAETAWPRRTRSFPRVLRWPNNLGLAVLNALLLRMVFPVTAVALAIVAEARGWGLMALFDPPPWFGFLLGFIILDLAIYLQHVLFHAAPSLWRLHRMHHADLDLDATSGLRFHPLEILLSMIIKFMVVAAAGVPAGAVLLFEIVLNATSMFNHANLKLPLGLDRVLRLVLVTPDMHRVHHSPIVRETNSNFGFNLPWWDRLFGTYRDQPERGHDGMTIGLAQFRNARDLWLDRMLVQPLKGDADLVPRGRRERTD
jgi:sterol desaturase/sphingolipid hydroxylase (fatty acid hydroxylase superfamily)